MLIVEDEQLVSLLLTELLTKSGFEVRACASAGEVNAVVAEFDPDVALLDINLGSRTTRIDLGNLLHLTSPHIGLVFLTKFVDPRLRRDRTIPPGKCRPRGTVLEALFPVSAGSGSIRRDGLSFTAE